MQTSWRSLLGLHMGLSVPFGKDLLWHQSVFFLFMEVILTQGWTNFSDTSKPDGPSSSLLFHSSCRASHLMCQVTWGTGAVTGEMCRSLLTFLHPQVTVLCQAERELGIPWAMQGLFWDAIPAVCLSHTPGYPHSRSSGSVHSSVNSCSVSHTPRYPHSQSASPCTRGCPPLLSGAGAEQGTAIKSP